MHRSTVGISFMCYEACKKIQVDEKRNSAGVEKEGEDA
jgi:hypothetical protein